MKVKSLSCVRLLATAWTAEYQAPPCMGFSRQEYWSGVPSPALIKCLTNSKCCVFMYLHDLVPKYFAYVLHILSQNRCTNSLDHAFSQRGPWNLSLKGAIGRTDVRCSKDAHSLSENELHVDSSVHLRWLVHHVAYSPRAPQFTVWHIPPGRLSSPCGISPHGRR